MREAYAEPGGQAAGADVAPGADRPRRALGIEIAEYPHGLVVRQAAPGWQRQLNNTASVILELCDGQHTVAEIAAALAETFALTDPPLAETAACVAELRSAEVLAPAQPVAPAPGATNTPFDFFAAIYCLNLDQRPDRWENALRRFGMLNITSRVERFPAIPTPHNHHEGCTISWRLMVAQARDRGLANFLGIEDDAIFLDTTLEVLSRAVSELAGMDWDLLYLGGAAWEEPAEIPGHVALQSPRSLACTHALAVNHSAYERILADVPEADGIDEWLTTYPAIDQYLYQQVNAGYYRAYVLNPRVATQVELTVYGVLDAPLRDRYTIR
jgi:Coenzyme PQQ synthesis protein D (PqqD)